MVNYYKVLGLSADAQPEEIKRAYFKLIRQFPPDKEPERFKALRIAYEILQNQDYRDTYGFIQSMPSPFREVYLAAKQYEEKKEYTLAIKVCQEGLRVEPDQSELNYYLVNLYLLNQETGKAVKHLESLLKKYPSDKKLNEQLAIAYQERGWNKKAKEQFEKIYAAGESDDCFLVYYLKNLSELNQYQKAFDLSNELMDRNPIGFKNKNKVNKELISILSLIFLHTAGKKGAVLYQRLEAFIQGNKEDTKFCKDILFDSLDNILYEFDKSKHDEEIINAIVKVLHNFQSFSPKEELAIMDAEFFVENAKILQDERFSLTIKEAAETFYKYKLSKDGSYGFMEGDMELHLLDDKLMIISEYESLREELLIIKGEYPFLSKEMGEFLEELDNNDNKSYLWNKYEKLFCREAGYPAGSHLKRNTGTQQTEGEYNPFSYQEPYKRETPKTGRNDPCPCGSGKKYKQCCGR